MALLRKIITATILTVEILHGLVISRWLSPRILTYINSIRVTIRNVFNQKYMHFMNGEFWLWWNNIFRKPYEMICTRAFDDQHLEWTWVMVICCYYSEMFSSYPILHTYIPCITCFTMKWAWLSNIWGIINIVYLTPRPVFSAMLVKE